jgi:hypothetical protein
MSKKTKVFTPENMQIIADLRAKKVPSVKIATILGVSPSALARAVAKHDLPRQKKKTKAKAFVVSEYVHLSGTAPMSLGAIDDKPQRVDHRDFSLLDDLSRGQLPKADHTIRVYETALDMRQDNRPRADNPFRLKGRVCEFDRDRTALLEEVEAEIDKVFRKFRTLAGPNSRIENPDVFGRLSTEAHAAYNHLQALMSAARRLRAIKVEIAKAALDLHLAGAAATRATA